MVLVGSNCLVHVVVRDGLLHVRGHVLPLLIVILVIDLPFGLVSIFLFVVNTSSSLVTYAIDCHVVYPGLPSQGDVLCSPDKSLLLALIARSTVEFYHVIQVID
jgi:hypothetical protein